MRDVFVQGQKLNAWYFGQLVANLPKDKLTAQPGGLKNHPLWIVGHLYFASQAQGSMIGATQPCSQEYTKLFGMGSQPLADASKYPKFDELCAKYLESREVVSKAFLAASEADLARPNPVEAMAKIFPTVGSMIALGMVSHDAVHFGQLSSWRRAMGLPAVF